MEIQFNGIDMAPAIFWIFILGFTGFIIQWLAEKFLSWTQTRNK